MSEEPTTPDLVELYAASLQDLERRDFDVVVSSFAPDAIWDASIARIGSFGGAGAIRDHIEAWLSAYEEWEYQLQEGQDLGTESCSLFSARMPVRLAAPVVFNSGQYLSPSGLRA